MTRAQKQPHRHHGEDEAIHRHWKYSVMHSRKAYRHTRKNTMAKRIRAACKSSTERSVDSTNCNTNAPNVRQEKSRGTEGGRVFPRQR
jgi:hypothetical protein